MLKNLVQIAAHGNFEHTGDFTFDPFTLSGRISLDNSYASVLHIINSQGLMLHGSWIGQKNKGFPSNWEMAPLPNVVPRLIGIQYSNGICGATKTYDIVYTTRHKLQPLLATIMT